MSAQKLDDEPLKYPHIVGIEAVSRVLGSAETKIVEKRFDQLTDEEIALRDEYFKDGTRLRTQRTEQRKNPPPPAPEPKVETKAAPLTGRAALVPRAKASTIDALKKATTFDETCTVLAGWLSKKSDHVAAPAFVAGLLCRFVVDANARNRERNEKIDNLTARLTALEHAYAGTAKRLDATMFDAGVWQSDAQYSRGALVSYKGQAVVCQCDETRDEPMTSKAWRLVVKRGRDGKDAR